MAASARTILFLDDEDVLYRSGTKRVLVPLQKNAANPLLKGHDKPWETAIAWTSVYRNPTNGHYQFWYQAFAGTLRTIRHGGALFVMRSRMMVFI
jgi:hypothetical protein